VGLRRTITGFPRAWRVESRELKEIACNPGQCFCGTEVRAWPVDKEVGGSQVAMQKQHRAKGSGLGICHFVPYLHVYSTPLLALFQGLGEGIWCTHTGDFA
jgi:hypothetical protein